MRTIIFALLFLSVFFTSCHDNDDFVDGDPLIYFIQDSNVFNCITANTVSITTPAPNGLIELRFVSQVEVGIKMLTETPGVSVDFAPGYTYEDNVIYDRNGLNKQPRHLVIVNVVFDDKAAPDAVARFELQYFIDNWNPIIDVTRGDIKSLLIKDKTDLLNSEN